jgi:hypothetical protein
MSLAQLTVKQVDEVAAKVNSEKKMPAKIFNPYVGKFMLLTIFCHFLSHYDLSKIATASGL